MKGVLEVELKILEGTNQVVIVCAETGREIGIQKATIIESRNEGFTVATTTFDIPPKRLKNDFRRNQG